MSNLPPGGRNSNASLPPNAKLSTMPTLPGAQTTLRGEKPLWEKLQPTPFSTSCENSELSITAFLKRRWSRWERGSGTAWMSTRRRNSRRWPRRHARALWRQKLRGKERGRAANTVLKEGAVGRDAENSSLYIRREVYFVYCNKLQILKKCINAFEYRSILYISNGLLLKFFFCILHKN